MKESINKKELIDQYKNRKQVGGVYVIKNTRLNKWFVDSAPDLIAIKNRFEFMGASFMKIAQDYKTQNGEDFVFEVLEDLEKGEAQTPKEFQDDLRVLKSIWLDKLIGQELY
jgi:hypothetical protein